MDLSGAAPESGPVSPSGGEQRFFQKGIERPWEVEGLFDKAMDLDYYVLRTSGIGPGQAAAMRAELGEALPIACELFDCYWEMSLAMGERIGTWGDDAPACYIATVADCRPNYYGDVIRVMCPDGVVRDSFSTRDFRAYLT